MRRYETIIIIDPDVKEDARQGLIERVGELIPQHSGFLIEVDDWGQRRLAYEIKKKIRGHYTRLDYCGDGTLVDEMERNFRIDDRVMKYMTVQLEEDANVEMIKESMDLKKAEKLEAENAAQAKQTEMDSDQGDKNNTDDKPSESDKSGEEE